MHWFGFGLGQFSGPAGFVDIFNNNSYKEDPLFRKQIITDELCFSIKHTIEKRTG